WEDQTEDHAEYHQCHGIDDRNETTTAEESEVLRQFHSMESLPEHGGDDSDDHTRENTVGPVDRRLEPDEVFFQPLECLHSRDGSEGLYDGVEHHETDDRGEPGRPVTLAREPDRDADGEQ